MKKLITLVTILMMTSTVFCQPDINLTTTKELPISVIKLMIQDVIRLDSLSEQCDMNDKYITELERMNEIKDSIISSLDLEKKYLTEKVEIIESKNVMMQHYSNTLEVAIKKEKSINKFKDMLSLGVIGFLFGIIILN